MSGSLRNVRRKPCSSARSASPEPGSVIATNWRPSGRSDQKCLEQRQRLDRPARLRRDEEQRLARGRRRSRTARIAPASVESSTCSDGPAVAVAEAQADHLGRERRAAHAEQHDVRGSPRRGSRPRTPRGRRRPRASCRRSSASRAGWRPRPGRPGPRACRPSSRCGARRPRPSPCGRARRSAARGRRGSSAWIVGGREVTIASRFSSMPSSSLSIGSTNFVDAVGEQLRGDLVEVDARLGQRAQVGLGVDLDRAAFDVRVVGGGEQRRHRHRVDRLGADEPVDVHRVRVLRVLHAGRGPQRPLDRRARLAQLREAIAVEDRP